MVGWPRIGPQIVVTKLLCHQLRFRATITKACEWMVKKKGERVESAIAKVDGPRREVGRGREHMAKKKKTIQEGSKEGN